MAVELAVRLNTGASIPAIGLGTWQAVPGPEGEMTAAIEVALKEGYRHIDCASSYDNEVEIGEALHKCFQEGVVKRENVFVTSKLWCDSNAPQDVLPACQSTLKDLRLDYLDLYLVHIPFALRKGSDFSNLTEEDKLGYSQEAIAKTWAAMEALVAKGLVKAIGLSNFTITKTEDVLRSAKIVPAVNQVECHPYLQQKKLKRYCDKKGIVFEAYAPIGSPARTFRPADEPMVLEDPVVVAIATKHNATPAQVCISFLLHKGIVVVSKSVNPKRIAENFKSSHVRLDPEDIQQLEDLDRNCMLFRPEMEMYLKEGVTWEEGWDVNTDTEYEL